MLDFRVKHVQQDLRNDAHNYTNINQKKMLWSTEHNISLSTMRFASLLILFLIIAFLFVIQD